jgi:hypothetical protein
LVTGTYKTQCEITVTASPLGAIGGSFEVTYIQCGTTYTNESHTTSWTVWADAGTTVTVSDPQYTIPDTRYKFDHYDTSNQVTMSEPRTITLVYTELPCGGVVTTSSLGSFDTELASYIVLHIIASTIKPELFDKIIEWIIK